MAKKGAQKPQDAPSAEDELRRLRTRIVNLEHEKAKSETQVIELRKLQEAAEKARQRTENAYRNLVDEVGSIILRCAPDGTIRFCNRYTLSFFGHAAHDLVGRNIIGTLIPEIDSDGNPQRELFEKIVKRPNQYLSHENENLLRDGRRVWISWTNRVVLDDDEKPEEILCVGNDVTERKKHENELKKLNHSLSRQTEELIRVNQELNAFTRTVAHDLRRPLTSISGFAQLLEHETRPEQMNQYIYKIINSCTTMNDMIQRFLDFARAPQAPLQYVPIDLSMLARKLLFEFQVQEPQRQVHIFVEPDMSVRGDENLVRQLMQNLLDNAWKYTSKNSAARIEVGTETDAKTGKRTFFVRDNGAGFDMAQEGKLFKPFSRLHDHTQFDGTGIGLATVQRIIQRHGGSIRASSEPGKGATFYFTLG